MWCDASGIVLGVLPSVDDKVIEDQCWLCPGDDKRHINIAELDTVIKVLHLALRWPAKKLVLHIDSKTVHGWLRQALSDICRVGVGGLHELLVK